MTKRARSEPFLFTFYSSSDELRQAMKVKSHIKLVMPETPYARKTNFFQCIRYLRKLCRVLERCNITYIEHLECDDSLSKYNLTVNRFVCFGMLTSKKLYVSHISSFRFLKRIETHTLVISHPLQFSSFRQKNDLTEKLYNQIVTCNPLLQHLVYEEVEDRHDVGDSQLSQIHRALKFNRERYFKWVTSTLALMVKRRIVSHDIMKQVLAPLLLPILERNIVELSSY